MAQGEFFLENSFRTDLACESRDVWTGTRGADPEGVSARSESRDGLAVETVEIRSGKASEALCKPKGRYVTISLDALVRREEDAFRRACGVLAREIRTQLAMEPDESALVVGLGNPDITPDAVGPLAVACVLVTRHLKTRLPEEFAAFRPVSVFRTGVLGTTGIESAALVRGVVSLVRPDRVIAVDALSARDAARLCRAVQVTNAGIVPAPASATRAARSQRTFSAFRSSPSACRRSWTRARSAPVSPARRPFCRRIRSFSSRRGTLTAACATAPGSSAMRSISRCMTASPLRISICFLPDASRAVFHVKHCPALPGRYENVSRETVAK